MEKCELGRVIIAVEDKWKSQQMDSLEHRVDLE